MKGVNGQDILDEVKLSIGNKRIESMDANPDPAAINRALRIRCGRAHSCTHTKHVIPSALLNGYRFHPAQFPVVWHVTSKQRGQNMNIVGIWYAGYGPAYYASPREGIMCCLIAVRVNGEIFRVDDDRWRQLSPLNEFGGHGEIPDWVQPYRVRDRERGEIAVAINTFLAERHGVEFWYINDQHCVLAVSESKNIDPSALPFAVNLERMIVDDCINPREFNRDKYATGTLEFLPQDIVFVQRRWAHWISHGYIDIVQNAEIARASFLKDLESQGKELTPEELESFDMYFPWQVDQFMKPVVPIFVPHMRGCD